MRKIVKNILCAAAGAALLCGAATVAGQTTQPVNEAQAFVSGIDADGTVHLQLNKGTVLTTRGSFRRVSVAQPEIADVTIVGANSILVTAKKAGSTQVIIWDEFNRPQVIDVTVLGDFKGLAAELSAVFPENKVEISTANGTIILKGRVPDLETAERMEKVALPYGKVLNFLTVSGGQQVMLQVRFAEVSKTATSNLGVNFTGADGTSVFGALTPGQIGPSSVSPAVSVFGGGKLASVQFEYFLNALKQNNLMRVLAEPNLIASSGETAAFTAGGEIPIPVSQGGGTAGGGAAVTVEYKKFGVQLNFVPVVLGQGKIRIKVEPEVSDLDFSNAVRSSGFLIPALTKRTVSTTVELSEGQTFAIAGLLNNRVQATKDMIPILGELPGIGALFRSVQYSRQQTELVVLVTPRLVEPMNPEHVPPLPGEIWRHPTEADLFWNADLGGPAEESDKKLAQATPGGAPKFKGSYGFTPPATQAQ
jgi:pilus assembly protein CpaC